MAARIGATRRKQSSNCSRSFAFALLAYQFAFFNIILPAHTRGAVTVDGRASACPLCCLGKSESNSSQKEPTSRDREHCAICDFAAHVTLPQTICFALPMLGVLHLLPIPPPQAINLPELVSSHLCRGPPIAASNLLQLI